VHKSAYINIEKYIIKYLGHLENKNTSVLDIGSMNINGSCKSLFTDRGWKYTGIDIEAGNGVDLVLKDPHKYPFEDNIFDVAVSISCFEHDEMFWLSFKEIVRVLKNGGHFFLLAPHKDGLHMKIDCWRFNPDGYRALCKWEPKAILLDAFIDNKPHRDCCGAFLIKK
jgi:SAM-dependent methyltransferase